MKVVCLFKLFVISGLVSSNMHSKSIGVQIKYSVTNNKSAEGIIYKAAHRPMRYSVKYKYMAKSAAKGNIAEKNTQHLLCMGSPKRASVE